SLKWTCGQLFLKSRMLHQQCGVNSWNAFVRAKLNEVNQDREQGDRIKLTRFIAENKDELTRAHARLSSAEKWVYNAQVIEARKQKNRVARANPKAILHDINATFTSMDREACILLLLFAAALRIFQSRSYEHTAPHRQRPLNKLVSECRTFIQEGLDSITLETNIRHKVKMNYTNYERNIVERCGIAL
ncbi:hypothetical protein DEU56DRAFT_695593, partial [Suillus clintonianus]|uniref:uncharacterized protein n=1 Tax=Suillus clintonianus TaxID=1904413 RepID=UPI001B871912